MEATKFWTYLALVLVISPGSSLTTRVKYESESVAVVRASNDDSSIDEPLEFHPFMFFSASISAKADNLVDKSISKITSHNGEVLKNAQSNAPNLPVPEDIVALQHPINVDLRSTTEMKEVEKIVYTKIDRIDVSDTDAVPSDSLNSDEDDSDSSSSSSEEASDEKTKSEPQGCGCLSKIDDDDSESDEDSEKEGWEDQQTIRMQDLDIFKLGSQLLSNIGAGFDLFEIAEDALDTLIDDRKHNRSFGAQNIIILAAMGFSWDSQINSDDAEESTISAEPQVPLNSLTSATAPTPIIIVDKVEVRVSSDHDGSDREAKEGITVMEVFHPQKGQGLEMKSFIVGGSVAAAFCIVMILLWKFSKEQTKLDQKSVTDLNKM